MKKTLSLALSLLAAVAFQASAIEAQDVTFSTTASNINADGYLAKSNAKFSWDNGGTLHNYTMDFSIIAAANNPARTVLTLGTDTGNYLSVSLKDVDGVYSVTLTHGTGTSSSAAQSFSQTTVPAVAYESGVSYTLAVAGDYAYLWKTEDAPEAGVIASWIDETGPQDEAYLQLSTSGVESYQLISGTAHAWSNGGNTKVAVWSVTAIPEPATATLSLLALAGLAARRRRK